MTTRIAEPRFVAHPRRVQRSRQKGSLLAPSTRYVGRPSKWGNPHGDAEAYRRGILDGELPYTAADISAELGHYEWLACWCPLDRPCHADALLEIIDEEKTITMTNVWDRMKKVDPGFMLSLEAGLGGCKKGNGGHIEEMLRASLGMENLLKSVPRPSRAALGGVLLKSLREGGRFSAIDERASSFGFEPSNFDIEAFIADERTSIHIIPTEVGNMRFTCSRFTWSEYQDAAADAVRRQVASAANCLR